MGDGNGCCGGGGMKKEQTIQQPQQAKPEKEGGCGTKTGGCC